MPGTLRDSLVLLGYRFSPRLADVGSTRLWCIDGQADYGLLNMIVLWNTVYMEALSKLLVGSMDIAEST